MSPYPVEKPDQLAVGIASRPEEVLMIGDGALAYQDIFEEIGPVVEVGTMSHAFPNARALVELALPRMYREDFDSLYALKPLYLRRSAKRIQWQRIRERRRSA